MASELETWARTERQFLKEEIKWFKAGAVLASPSGENISAKKLVELELRLEHLHMALDDQNHA